MPCLEMALMVERSATMWSGPSPWLNVVLNSLTSQDRRCGEAGAPFFPAKSRRSSIIVALWEGAGWRLEFTWDFWLPHLAYNSVMQFRGEAHRIRKLTIDRCHKICHCFLIFLGPWYSRTTSPSYECRLGDHF